MKSELQTKKRQIAEAILDYWHTIEFLGQDAFPALTYEEMRKNRDAVKETTRKQLLDELLPIEGVKKPEKKNGLKFLRLLHVLDSRTSIIETVSRECRKHGMNQWGNISLYFGCSKREDCIQKIAETLCEKDDRPERNDDQIAWFSLQVNPEGEYVEESFSLSPVIWAMNQVLNYQGQSLSQFLSEKNYSDNIRSFDEYLVSIGKQKQDSEVTAICLTDLEHIWDQVYRQYIQKALSDDSAFYCVLVYQAFADDETQENYEDDSYMGLNKNFFSNDLNLTRTKVKDGEFGSKNKIQHAVIDYITGAYAGEYPDAGIAMNNECRFDLSSSAQNKENKAEIRDFLSEILNVQNAPLGKWPSRFMPALMQQIAVNLAVNKVESQPIFSVNGPPGTGKTTLLKEIIVNHIISKALLLAEYERPNDAFEECNFAHGDKKKHSYSNFCPQYYKLKNDKINAYSILVASSNNAAVENITKELPKENGITEALRPMDLDSELLKQQLQEVQDLFTVEKSGKPEMLYQRNNWEKKGEYKDIYFTEYARALLNDDDAWGLISVSLGKRSNIHQFYQKVLFPLFSDFYANEKLDNRLSSYKAARQQLFAQKKKVEDLRDALAVYCNEEKRMRTQCAGLNKRIKFLQQEIIRTKKCLLEYNQEKEHLNKSLDLMKEVFEAQEEVCVNINDQMIDIKTNWGISEKEYEVLMQKTIAARDSIGFIGRILHTKNAAAKESLANHYETQANEIKQQVDFLRETYWTSKDELDVAVEKFNEIKQERGGAATQLVKTEKAISETKDQLAGHEQEIKYSHETINNAIMSYCDMLKDHKCTAEDVDQFIAIDDDFMDLFFSEDETENTKAQVSNLWFTDHYNREREKLFFYALQLNKEFVLSSKCCMMNYKNLALLWREETTEDSKKVIFDEKDRQACLAPLLQSLFLLVPVISTTFASVGSFLRDVVQPNALGTLIVDEAGQAPPQMAIGALYRSRSAVIVGDPKQVEPVVTDELELLKKAYKEEIYQPYRSKRISVQQFADGINPYGTWLEDEYNQKEWVGCPLVVHRRCISPMYDISNHISYNNTMKQQTAGPNAAKEALFCYAGSRWINVSGNERGNKDHFVENQGQRVLEILEIAFGKTDFPSLFIITPFTSVKKGMQKCIEKAVKGHPKSILYAKSERVISWMYKNIGTVHTFQGREANEVIFLLGCDAGKGAAGAVQWVNANIVNVAVTRAKYRLYIIGDENAWKNSRYVSQAKCIIDTFALKELSVINNQMSEGAEEQEKVKELFQKI